MNCRNSANFSSYRSLVDSSLAFVNSSCQYVRAADDGYKDLMLNAVFLLLCVTSGWAGVLAVTRLLFRETLTY
jgi:hypothetical protein